MRHQILDIKHLKAVAFDWDNTLACTRDALVFAVNKVLDEFNMPPWEKVCELRDKNLSFHDNFPLIFGKNAAAAYARYVEIYKENALKMVHRPEGAAEVLDFFKKRGIPLVLVTNKDRNLIEFELPQLYDCEVFDNMVCAHEASADKPNAKQLVAAVSMVADKINAQSVWMVGDSDMDKKCALSAGATFIRIGQHMWADGALIKADDEIYFADFKQFYHILAGQLQ